MRLLITCIFGILVVFSFTKVKAQDIYQTFSGKIVAVSELNESSVSLHSNNASVFLNYEQALFKIDIPLNTIKSDVDTINMELSKFQENSLKIVGDMALGSINTEQHPPLDFEIKGNMNYQGASIDFIGEGHLEHIEGSEYVACMLGLNFDIKPDAEFLPHTYQTLLKNPIRIQLLQSVLDKQKQSEDWEH